VLPVQIECFPYLKILFKSNFLKLTHFFNYLSSHNWEDSWHSDKLSEAPLRLLSNQYPPIPVEKFACVGASLRWSQLAFCTTVAYNVEKNSKWNDVMSKLGSALCWFSWFCWFPLFMCLKHFKLYRIWQTWREPS
jgi:hypothetical protein